jgi:hypothetical protein
MKTITRYYIDGAFVESHGREVMDIIRPTDRKVIGRVTLADEEDTRRAIAAAKRAFATYISRRPPASVLSPKYEVFCRRSVGCFSRRERSAHI